MAQLKTNMTIFAGLIRSQCLNDGTPEVRDAAFSSLAAIAKVELTSMEVSFLAFVLCYYVAYDLVSIGCLFLYQLVGMKPLERSLEKLDDIRRKKLNEMIGTTGNSQTPSATSGNSNFPN